MAIKKIKDKKAIWHDINDARIEDSDIESWSGKQDELIAGTNITIEDNVISLRAAAAI